MRRFGSAATASRWSTARTTLQTRRVQRRDRRLLLAFEGAALDDGRRPEPRGREGRQRVRPLPQGTPDWITVRTKQVFIPLRVREDDVRKLTAELEARTGTRVVTTK